ncbi:SdpI family protein [Thermococcus sp. LS1]|nr:SdpI family protein [Thermococcus sp. LS1]
MGALTFTAKDEPGIGFRIGYTYLSERARRKANRVSGGLIIATGTLLIIAGFFLPMFYLWGLLLVGLLSSVAIAYLVAKREYELEELSVEAPEGKGREIKPPDVRRHLAFQAICLLGVLALSPRLPEGSVAFFSILIAVFMALTAFASRPLVFQLAPSFKGKMARGFAFSMSVASLMLLILALGAAFNVGVLGGLLLTFLCLTILAYGVFKALVSAYEEGYY